MLCLLVSACRPSGLIGHLSPSHSNLTLPQTRKGMTVPELANCYSANPAYLAVAMRCFAQQGWFVRENASDGVDYLYHETEMFFQVLREGLDVYQRIGDFLIAALPFERSLLGTRTSSDDLCERFTSLVREANDSWNGCGQPYMRDHWTGALIVPLMVALLQMGLLDQPVNSFDLSIPGTTRLLAAAGWIDIANQCWTEAGELGRGHALYLGMMCSYIPMLVRLRDIIFGDAFQRTHVNVGQTEQHVDRKLNILASGAAHRKYFSNVDEIFVDIFNQNPIESQPRFVMDIGCGDGSWLKHIYRVVRDQTHRGKVLESHPLLMIGVDYNVVCEKVCLDLLREASIPALFLTGDITDPADIAAKLEPHRLSMNAGLHIRSFIDHNRVYEVPLSLPRHDVLQPSSAYASEDNRAIRPGILQRNLVEFLQKWTPYADPHGLVILEGHCVDPAIVRWHLGDTHNLVFDTYHGFSHQYPVDFEVFMAGAAEAGLYPVIHEQQRYPSRKPFVSISANRFKSTSPMPSPMPSQLLSLDHNRGIGTDDRSGEWHPRSSDVLPDVMHNSEADRVESATSSSNEDGDRLHALLYCEGDLRYPRPWCHPPTGRLLRPILKRIGTLLDRIEHREQDRREICLVDYGTGTGMAAIELLRACHANGYLRRCLDLGVRLRLCLLDLPSNWFAKAYELLSAYPFVEFYAIRDEATGSFLPLISLVGVGQVDIVLASMVFHLIRPEPLSRVLHDIASILAPSGLLVWNSPDIGPAGRDTVLFHHANREIRRMVLDCIERPERLLDTRWAMRDQRGVEAVCAQLHRLQSLLDSTRLASIRAQADRQILPSPNLLPDLLSIATPYFDTTHYHTLAFEMCSDEVIDTLLVPANQRYLGEIPHRDLRECLIKGLMTHDVIPGIQHGPAGTRQGYAVHWTFGEFISNL